MLLDRVEYLRWAKSLPPCRFRLCDSGVPDVRPAEFPLATSSVRLDEHNPYGLISLIETLARRYEVDEERVLPLAGASGANFVALAAILEPGDRVVLERPGYEPIERVVRFLGAEVQWAVRSPGDAFRLDLQQVQAHLNSGARAVVVTDLHNPSGARLPPGNLDQLVAMTARTGAWLIVDEVYLEYASVNRGEAARPAARLGDHVITTNSLTKVYGLGRLRAGWMLAAPRIIDRARDVLDRVCGANSAVSEQLAVEALARIEQLAQRTRDAYEAGWAVFRRWLESQPELDTADNDGAPFAFPRISGMPDTRTFCERLAREHDTLIVPGAFFGAPEHVRISFCLAPDLVTEGLRRISEALERRGAEGAEN